MGALFIEARIAKGPGCVMVATMIDLGLLKNGVDQDEAVRALRGQHGGEAQAEQITERAGAMPTQSIDPEDDGVVLIGRDELPPDERPSADNPSGMWRPNYSGIREELTPTGRSTISFARASRR